MPKVTEAHRAARRQQILTAMLRCVERDGFHKTTMAAVIEESGVSAGSVYLYFKSKQDLIRAIAEIAVSGVGATIAELAAADVVVPPAEAMERATGRFLTLGDELGVEVPKVAIQAWAEAARDPEIRAIIAAEARQIRQAWETYVVRAADAGFIAQGAQPARAAQVLMGMLPGFILQRVIFGDVEPDEYAAGLADLLG